MIAPIPFTKFASGWLPMLAASAVVDPAPRLADAWPIALGGLSLPGFTCLLGVVGVLLGRPLARRQESKLSWPMFAIVSAILLISIEVWIADSRPPALFAFVLAVGVGFSGFSLIELVGEQLRDMLMRAIGAKSTSSSAAPMSGDKNDR